MTEKEKKKESRLKCGDYELDEVVSALQKEIRRGFHERAFCWAVTMVNNGYEDYMWRRLMVILAEDIGYHDLRVAPFVVAMFQANELATVKVRQKSKTDTNFLASAILAMCKAVKTREGCDLDEYVGYCIEHGLKLEVPPYALDMHTKRGRDEGGLSDDDGTKGNRLFEMEGRKLHPEAPIVGDYKKYRDACARRLGLPVESQAKDDIGEEDGKIIDPKPELH
jgi:replication-associated recombination protein RarA